MKSNASSGTTPSTPAARTVRIARRCSTSARCSVQKRCCERDCAPKREFSRHRMSIQHPIIAVTGSSGAGTTTVMKSFAHIFRREGLKAQIIEGDSFHRYNRVEMRERVRVADSGASPPISHFGPEANLLDELAATLAEYGATGRGKLRRYVHDVAES